MTQHCAVSDCAICSVITDRRVLTSLVPGALMDPRGFQLLNLGVLVVVLGALGVLFGRARR